MNAFDLIVTVALGSTLATVMLSKDVALIDGAAAFFLLIFLQFGLTWLSSRSKEVSKLIKATPSLLVYKGELLTEMMLKERIDEDEIFYVLRQNGLSSIVQADAVILEADGSLTVVQKLTSLKTSVMTNLLRPSVIDENK
nr:YetF domain-containing protein [Segetibacter sp. 3557_3]